MIRPLEEIFAMTKEEWEEYSSTFTDKDWAEYAKKRMAEVHYGDEDPIFPPGERIREKLRARGITQKNWLRHLDDMTDQEITVMLTREWGAERLEEDRKAYPHTTDRARAEYERDL